MRLTHLTVVGFKSFAKKTTIEVSKSVTGIVGPNGSGKSNIAEAIRFVLGEQSIKSMRGKLTTDLLYKGSSHIAPASRATVSLTLDNREKKQSKADAGDLANFLVYDEIILSRILYADGTSEYTINDAKVRLKDVQELLALAGIGSSQLLIISQGEADRLLVASPRDRKELLEDALGLRIFHIRLKESERKLDRVKEHMREVDLLRKEIAPQLSFLQKEVHKLEKIENEKAELTRLFAMYSHFENKAIKEMETKLDDQGEPRALKLILESLEKEMRKEMEEKQNVSSDEATLRLEHKHRIQSTMREVQSKRDHLSRTIGRLEAERAYLEKEEEKIRNQSEIVTVTNRTHVLASLLSEIDACILALESGDPHRIRQDLHVLKENIKKVLTVQSGTSSDVGSRLSLLLEDLSKHEVEEKQYTHELVTLQDELDRLEENLVEEQAKELKEERHKRELVMRHGELKAKLREQEFLAENLKTKKDALAALTSECLILVGKGLHNVSFNGDSQPYDSYATKKSIDRFKLRIEDAGLSNGDEMKKEYEALRARDEYLSKELQDVIDSEAKLVMLVEELKKHIRTQFTEGIKHVSNSFNTMFAEVFKGGTASLIFIENIHAGESLEEGIPVEAGIDIKVSLPEKRIRDLSALSGGEKALTSIALSFAMSQIAPPPFMLLDETDAALDESNAKKYGLLLGKLAKNSTLLVITHNRETMSHCEMLYGITIGADGASKLLSITFDKAENFAN